MPAPLKIKQHDLQPYYRAKVLDSDGNPVAVTGATIYCTMRDVAAGTLKINRQTTGINITAGAGGEFEYRWQSGDTDTVSVYDVEFEINPQSGGKYTVPADKEAEPARVHVEASLDGQ